MRGRRRRLGRPWVGRADRVAFDRDPVAQLGGGNNDGRVHRITIDFIHDASRCAAVSHVTGHTRSLLIVLAQWYTRDYRFNDRRNEQHCCQMSVVNLLVYTPPIPLPLYSRLYWLKSARQLTKTTAAYVCAI